MSGTDPFDLEGRRVLVTGAGGLLGAEFASALAERGAEVHLADLSAMALAATVERLAGEGADAKAHAVDITDAAAVAQLVDDVGDLDALVNSAAIDARFQGLDGGGHLEGYPAEAFRLSLEVNLTGTFLVTQACCRTMARRGPRGRGSIVNVSSIYGLVGPDQRLYEAPDDQTPARFKPVDYATTKAGVIGFTRAVAALYRGTDIRVNALTPGGTFNGQDDAFVTAYADRTLLGRMAEPGDYRGPIVFLCSDASAYMTGANLVVDGGWTAV